MQLFSFRSDAGSTVRAAATACVLIGPLPGPGSPSSPKAASRQEGLSKLLEESGPTKAKDAAFHLGVFRYLLTLYKDMDFDGERSKGRYQRGKTMLSRMFRER